MFFFYKCVCVCFVYVFVNACLFFFVCNPIKLIDCVAICCDCVWDQTYKYKQRLSLKRIIDCCAAGLCFFCFLFLKKCFLVFLNHYIGEFKLCLCVLQCMGIVCDSIFLNSIRHLFLVFLCVFSVCVVCV